MIFRRRDRTLNENPAKGAKPQDICRTDAGCPGRTFCRMGMTMPPTVVAFGFAVLCGDEEIANEANRNWKKWLDDIYDSHRDGSSHSGLRPEGLPD